MSAAVFLDDSQLDAAQGATDSEFKYLPVRRFSAAAIGNFAPLPEIDDEVIIGVKDGGGK